MICLPREGYAAKDKAKVKIVKIYDGVKCTCMIACYHRSENFLGKNFLWCHDLMYYVNISGLLFSRLDVTVKISLLPNSPTCALIRTHGGQRDGDV